VLALLESDTTEPFTATYQVTRKLGPNTTTATVVQDGDRRSVTVGDVRFLHTEQDATCVLSTRVCEPGVQDARISDYSIGSAFWADGPARALRVAMTRRAGAPVASTQTGSTASRTRAPSTSRTHPFHARSASCDDVKQA